MIKNQIKNNSALEVLKNQDQLGVQYAWGKSMHLSCLTICDGQF